MILVHWIFKHVAFLKKSDVIMFNHLDHKKYLKYIIQILLKTPWIIPTIILERIFKKIGWAASDKEQQTILIEEDNPLLVYFTKTCRFVCSVLAPKQERR